MSDFCAKFSDATDLFQWAEAIRTSLGFQGNLVECRATICAALWGSGNPDISGIGVVVAFCVEIFASLILAMAIWSLRRFGDKTSRFYQKVEQPIMQGMSTFFDSSAFFCLAIQIASLVVLARRDFIVNTAGFGQYEAQMTWDISIACIIPLMYPIAMMNLWNRPAATSTSLPSGAPRKDDRYRKRQRYMVCLYCLSMILFIYPFLSQLLNNWRPSNIGDGRAPDNKPDITMAEFEAVFNLCFRDAQPLSRQEENILAIFEATSSAVILVFTAWTITITAISGVTGDMMPRRNKLFNKLVEWKHWAQSLWDRARSSWAKSVGLEMILLLLPMVLAGGLLWGIFRIRLAQKALAEATNNRYEDNEWTFGQLVAIVMFTPILSDMVYSWWYGVLK